MSGYGGLGGRPPGEDEWRGGAKGMSWFSVVRLLAIPAKPSALSAPAGRLKMQDDQFQALFLSPFYLLPFSSSKISSHKKLALKGHPHGKWELYSNVKILVADGLGQEL